MPAQEINDVTPTKPEFPRIPSVSYGNPQVHSRHMIFQREVGSADPGGIIFGALAERSWGYRGDSSLSVTHWVPKEKWKQQIIDLC